MIPKQEYTAEFKELAVKRVKTGQGIGTVARELGLVERFYQRVMHCYLVLGRPAEGLGVYRRMRQTLSVTLGLSPSPESDSLYKQLLTPASSSSDGLHASR